ncbi:MAG: RNA methyltransferase [Clostridia bacterium]|nr:RNA methyltransferase [Clostridia bacterium]
MERLTSLKNPKVLFWRSLADRKARKESGCFIVEGWKMVTEALASAFAIEAVLVREDMESEISPELTRYPVYLLPAAVFDAVCDTRTPQGIAAVLRFTRTEASGSRLIALDDVQDPGNVGTIIRTADAAGFTGVLLGSACADVFSPKVLRATMGSIFRMGISRPDDLAAELGRLRESGFSVLSSQLDGTPFYERTGVSDRFCLIIGNEGNGVSPAVSAQATHRLKLPMRGGAESLNAAIAAGIMMYDLTRDLD